MTSNFQSLPIPTNAPFNVRACEQVTGGPVSLKQQSWLESYPKLDSFLLPHEYPDFITAMIFCLNSDQFLYLLTDFAHSMVFQDPLILIFTSGKSTSGFSLSIPR